MRLNRGQYALLRRNLQDGDKDISDLNNKDPHAPNNDTEFIYYGIIALIIVFIISCTMGIWICWKRRQKARMQQNESSATEQVELLNVTATDIESNDNVDAI